MSFIPNKLRNMKFITLNREVHKWLGVTLAVFTLVISLTGFVLIHKKEWKWMKEIEVASWMIPGWYQEEMKQRSKEIKSLALVPEAHAAKGPIMAGTKAGLAVGDGEQWTAGTLQAKGEEVSSLLVTPGAWLAGTHRGLYRSTNHGQSWVLVTAEIWPKPEKLEVRTLARSLQEPDTIWMGTKMGLYRSMDGGAQWEDLTPQLPNKERAREVTALAFPGDQEGIVLIGTHNGLYHFDSQAGTMTALNTEGLGRLAEAKAPHVTLDKYLTQLHDGKLFGDKLWVLYDLTSWSLVLFVATGLYIWIYPKSVKRRKAREQARLAAGKTAGLPSTQNP